MKTVKAKVLIKLKNGFSSALRSKTIILDNKNRNKGILKDGREVTLTSEGWIYQAN